MAFDPQAFASQQLGQFKSASTFNPQAFVAKLGIKKKIDLGTVEGLAAQAERAGLGREAADIVSPTPKLSFLGRLGKGLGALNPAEAILTGTEKGIGAGLLEYPKGILKGIGSAITGTDYEPERRYFSDVVEKMGIKNGIAKFGIGFAGDVLLDPSTYFGGAIIKGIGVVGKGIGGTALKTVGKLAPDVETGLRLAGTGLQEALGRAFQYGYKATAGAKEDVLTFLSREQRARLGLAASNLDRLGTGILTQAQREELALKMIAGKRAEFGQRELSEGLRESSKYFEPMQNRALRLAETREKELKLLGTEINNLEKKGLRLSLKPQKEITIPQKTSGIQFKTIDEELKTTAPTNFDGLKNSYSTKDILKKEFKTFDLFKQEVEEGGWSRLQELGIDKKVAKSVAEQIFKRPIFKPSKTLLSDIPATLGNKETKQFIENLITLPKAELQNIKRLLGTREKWKTDLINEIETLQKEWIYFDELQQGELRMAEKIWEQKGQVAREVAQSSDPLVQKTIEEQIARSKKFAEGITENPYETYFPFIKKDKLDKFLNESRGMKVGSEGYRKQFKNLLTNENLELDPAKAFFTRESQIVSDKMTRDFLGGFVKKYGKQLDAFKNSDEAAKEGWQLIKEKGMFGKELGYVSKYDAALIKDSISPEFQTINMLAKATGFDAITSLFKRSVTGLFAPFHIRNFVSGNIQNFEVLGKDVFNPKNIAIGQKIAYFMGKGKEIPSGILNIAGKEMKFKDVLKPFIDRFSGDTFYNADFDMALKGGNELKSLAGILSKQRIKETIKTVGLGQEAIPFKIARGIGQFIEHQQKATAYITALGQGKKIPEALKLAEAAGFDYRALTRFESQIMRRIIPFYSFTRKNIGLQLSTLGENPQRINQILRFFGGMGTTPPPEEWNALPDYIKETFGVKIWDSPEGLKQYISNFGTPVEQFAQLLGSNPVLRAISQMNPLIKAPIEIGIGKDSFRQKDLKDVYDAREYKLAPQIIKDLLDIKEIQKPILKKNALGKLVKVGERTEYVADPIKLLIARSMFTSRGFSYLDQVFGSDLKGLVKLMKTTTGIKPQQFNIESLKAVKEKAQRRSLEDILSRAGEIKIYQKPYIPKK